MHGEGHKSQGEVHCSSPILAQISPDLIGIIPDAFCRANQPFILFNLAFFGDILIFSNLLFFIILINIFHFLGFLTKY